MAIIKTEAVVLKGWKLGETSKILLLYTKDHGRVKAVAKGARNPKSQFKGCLEPLSRIAVIYYDKPARDLQLLTKADLVTPHYHIIGDIAKTALGLATLELLNKAVAGEEPFPQVYDLLCSTLERLDRSEKFSEGIFWYFQNHFIELLGYRPNWSACLKCGASLRDSGGMFHPSRGGLVCGQCAGGAGGAVISGEALEILFWMQTCSISEACSIEPDPVQTAEIRRAFDLYFKTHLDYLRPLNSLKVFYEHERSKTARE
ncbi:DNA repair protein RecO [bacterium]|nr:DNA repair protein RecO [bacterium]